MGKHKNKNGPVTALIAMVVAVLMSCMPVAAMADMVGIDVSGWQDINVTCTAEYDFAVVKVSQGIGFENGSWRQQARCVTDRGKSLGLYHYAGGNNASSEADYFVSLASDYIGRAVLVLDWESYQNAQWGNSDWVREFVQRIHTLTGVWPMVYVQASALNQIPSDVRASCGLWVAQYASNAPTGYQSRPWNYAIYGEAMRQYTANGWISGYNGPLDLNYFRGDASQWQAYANPAGKAQTTTPPQVEKPPAQTVDLQALATATIRGDYGNGQQRRDALGANYDKVMAIVNQRLTTTPTTQTQHQATATGATRVTVRAGDTMSAIAARTGLWPLSKWNVPSGNLNLIYPGQVVTYNGDRSTAASGNATRSRTVTVRAGDTLSGIAARLGISYTQLSGYRSGNPNVIYPGEVLRY
ncbi:MAG: GH25 family lysozyme [Bifidobacterium scardovii]|jgi:GH25 family lysozyme M1 (1,4-beta-N-acetylmuramidase)/LysM repeat protein|uniref:GH25 family lysozyme n=1 Tax=Bifidobacterium scardovii TaxID=158787 RepID=UPI0020709C4E|nr:GH25 family lysozyme [Bifidobacterium scardovii]MDU2421314.1 GH25 family lysozyme [Bifidobacterium scardovii]DAZ29430.1 MAG TPA: hypothetical protein [Caudoviricetes sp.]